jgi:hypothetical protein
MDFSAEIKFLMMLNTPKKPSDENENSTSSSFCVSGTLRWVIIFATFD